MSIAAELRSNHGYDRDDPRWPLVRSMDKFQKLLDILVRLTTVKYDNRFAAMIELDHRLQIADIIRFLLHPRLPVYSHRNGPWTAVISGDRDFMFHKDDLRPVPGGFWMGWPEDEWKLPWEEMTVAEQAAFETKEQVTKYVPDQYHLQLMEFYYPQEYADLYWGQWKDVGDWNVKNKLAKKWLAIYDNQQLRPS